MQADDYILLLYKQLRGESSAAEDAAVQAWLSQSPENQQAAAQIRQIWADAGHYGKSFTPDLDGAFAQLKARIRSAEAPRAKRFALRPLLRVAAALALLLVALWGYRQWAGNGVETLQFAVLEQENAEKRAFDLPDGSQVWLRKGSRLDCPAQFGGAERRVRLQGEAFFSVAHNAQQPFVVETPDGDQVRVLGTEFDLKTRLDGDRKGASVYVQSGKVQFSPKGSAEGVVLTARQKASFDAAQDRLEVDKFASLNELAWQKGGLEFERTPLAEVLRDLEQHYGARIELRNPALHGCTYSAPLSNLPLDKILESLSLIYQVKVQRLPDNSYALSGGSCQ